VAPLGIIMSSASENLKLIEGALDIYMAKMDHTKMDHKDFVERVRTKCGRIPRHIWDVVCDGRMGHKEKANQLYVMLSQLVQQRGAQVNQNGTGNAGAAANAGGGKGSGKGKAKGGNAEGGHANGNHVQFVQNFGRFQGLTPPQDPPKKKRRRSGSGGKSSYRGSDGDWSYRQDRNARCQGFEDAIGDMVMVKRAEARANGLAYIYDKPEKDRVEAQKRADHQKVDDRAAHKKLDNGGGGGFAGWAPGLYRPRGW